MSQYQRSMLFVGLLSLTFVVLTTSNGVVRTSVPALAAAPSPTPLGGSHGRLAFDSGIGGGGGGVTTVLDLTTGQPHDLPDTNNDGHGFAWSPDGKRLAYVGDDSNRHLLLHVIAADGTEIYNIPIPSNRLGSKTLAWVPCK
ncbi:MAG: hypothetical protein ABI947_14595 [Chloroflexota bacterium]